MAKTWAGYFKESMESVRLKAPDDCWASAKDAGAELGKLLALLATLGPKTTMMELLIAAEGGAGAAATSVTTASRLVAGGGGFWAGISAAFYLGACVGAVIYATQMVTVGGFALNDADVKAVLNQASRYGIRISQDAALSIIASQSAAAGGNRA